MKPLHYISALALLAACTAGDGEWDGATGSHELQDVDITFRVAVAGNTLTTRSARPLESADPWQRTQCVRLYAFRSLSPDGPFQYTRPTWVDGRQHDYLYVQGFEKPNDQNWTSTINEGYEKDVHASVPKGFYYKFVAVGRDDITEAAQQNPVYDIAPVEYNTSLDNFRATLAGSRYTGTELFAGTTDTIHIDPQPAPPYFVDVTMHRAVAGLLMYVENVPVLCNGQVIKAVGIAPRKGMTTGVDLDTRKSHGQLQATTAPLIKVDIPASATSDAGTVGLSAIYKNTDPTNLAHPNALPIAGRFLTPQPPMSDYDDYVGRTPLALVYYNANGGEIARRNISIGATLTPGPGGSFIGDPQPPVLNNYPLLANNLYCVGYRYLSGTGSDPTEYDRPIDLSPGSATEDTGDIIMAYGSWQASINIEM